MNLRSHYSKSATVVDMMLVVLLTISLLIIYVFTSIMYCEFNVTLKSPCMYIYNTLVFYLMTPIISYVLITSLRKYKSQHHIYKITYNYITDKNKNVIIIAADTDLALKICIKKIKLSRIKEIKQLDNKHTKALIRGYY